MKQGIHPTYFPTIKVKCACGSSWTTGSTKESMSISICSACHPFYTGQDKIVDTRGRVEKFKKRLEKSVQKTALKKVKKSR